MPILLPFEVLIGLVFLSECLYQRRLRMENLNFANMTFPAVAMVDGDSDQLFNA